MTKIEIQDRDDAKVEAKEEPVSAAEEAAAEVVSAPVEKALSEEEKTYKEQLQRMKADFDNYRKRVARDAGEQFDAGVAALAQRVLPVMDNLALALESARAGHGGEPLVKGLEIVGKLLAEALEQCGVEAIEALGKPLDPRLHEVVLTEPTAGVPAETILAELQRGYRLKDRLLRPSKVKVAVALPVVETACGGEEKPN